MKVFKNIAELSFDAEGNRDLNQAISLDNESNISEDLPNVNTFSSSGVKSGNTLNDLLAANYELVMLNKPNKKLEKLRSSLKANFKRIFQDPDFGQWPRQMILSWFSSE